MGFERQHFESPQQDYMPHDAPPLSRSARYMNEFTRSLERLAQNADKHDYEVMVRHAKHVIEHEHDYKNPESVLKAYDYLRTGMVALRKEYRSEKISPGEFSYYMRKMLKYIDWSAKHFDMNMYDEKKEALHRYYHAAKHIQFWQSVEDAVGLKFDHLISNGENMDNLSDKKNAELARLYAEMRDALSNQGRTEEAGTIFEELLRIRTNNLPNDSMPVWIDDYLLNVSNEQRSPLRPDAIGHTRARFNNPPSTGNLSR